MGVFALFLFFVMLVTGGIAVDVMRFETRRVALQQTMDRAVLAAASLTQPDNLSPKAIAEDWFAKAGLGDELTVDYTAPTVTEKKTKSLRRVTASARVRSYSRFMHLLNVDYLEGPSASEAAQGVSNIEVMLVLDITGSMSSVAATGDTKTKIEALREAATDFVTLVKQNDTKNGVSIGMVPYSSQVNLPLALRQQYNATNVSSWNFVNNVGVPDINCIEIPTGTYTSTGLSTTLAMPMAAVADISSGVPTTSDYRAASSYVPQIAFGPRVCTTKADNTATAGVNEAEYNFVALPTKDGEAIKAKIGQLTAGGNTSIAVGMRWGTALIDQSARPIYDALITEPEMAGRPMDNADIDRGKVRKIIILMTDGEHVSNTFVRDAYKSGLSPIWRGTDGKYAIRFWSSGGTLNSGSKPGNCSGWSIASTRDFFVPHLKANAVRQKVQSTEAEGAGTGTSITGACDPRAWLAPLVTGNPTWPLLNSSGAVVKDASGNVVMVASQRLDWSEVWRFLRVDYVARQLYMRSGVSGTSDFNTLMNAFRATYLSVGTMNMLLQQNCTAAKNQDIEIYGIAFAAPANGQAQISSCATNVTEYYYDATNYDDLMAAFREIATQISDLRLTQ